MPHALLAGAYPQPQQMIVNPLLLNPALLAATSGYSSTAAAQQLLFSQSLANTNGINPLVQQQINSLISAEFARLAAEQEPPASVSLHDPPGMTEEDSSIESSLPPPSSSNDVDDDIACLGLGKEFLPATTQPTRLCDCGMALCREIGYPHKGSIRFSAQTVDHWCQILDITDPKRLAQIRSCPEVFSLAYWHFREEDRCFDKLVGQVRLTSKGSQVLPDAHLQSFVDNYKEASSEGDEQDEPRRPSKRMLELHKSWAQFRRSPTLEP